MVYEPSTPVVAEYPPLSNIILAPVMPTPAASSATVPTMAPFSVGVGVGTGVVAGVGVGDGAGVEAGTITVIVSVPGLPALSVAVTVITLSPFDRLMFEIDQLVVPLASPLPPLSLLNVTSFTPLVLSDALPLKLTVLLVAVYVSLDVGLVIVTMGAVVSRVIESLAELDTFPAASLYHTYTVFCSSPLVRGYEALPL